jgi:hypothetical protein
MKHPNSGFLFSLMTLLALFLSDVGGMAQSKGIPQPADVPRVVTLFDRSWKFHLGEAIGAENERFDDASWRSLDLPHDWMIEGVPEADPSTMEGSFDKNSPAGATSAYLNGGVGWYRKMFMLPDSGKGQVYTLLFDGAYQNSHVSGSMATIWVSVLMALSVSFMT